MAKNKAPRIAILLLLLAAAVGAFYFYEAENKAPARALILYGNVDIRQVQLAFHDDGRILRLLVEEGLKRFEKNQSH